MRRLSDIEGCLSVINRTGIKLCFLFVGSQFTTNDDATTSSVPLCFVRRTTTGVITFFCTYVGYGMLVVKSSRKILQVTNDTTTSIRLHFLPIADVIDNGAL